MRGRERFPGVPDTSQEVALSRGKARGTPNDSISLFSRHSGLEEMWQGTEGDGGGFGLSHTHDSMQTVLSYLLPHQWHPGPGFGSLSWDL